MYHIFRLFNSFVLRFLTHTCPVLKDYSILSHQTLKIYF